MRGAPVSLAVEPLIETLLSPTYLFHNIDKPEPPFYIIGVGRETYFEQHT